MFVEVVVPFEKRMSVKYEFKDSFIYFVFTLCYYKKHLHEKKFRPNIYPYVIQNIIGNVRLLIIDKWKVLQIFYYIPL